MHEHPVSDLADAERWGSILMGRAPCRPFVRAGGADTRQHFDDHFSSHQTAGRGNKNAVPKENCVLLKPIQTAGIRWCCDPMRGPEVRARLEFSGCCRLS